LLRVAGDDEAAEKHLRAVLALSPNEPQARQKLAEVMAKRKAAKIPEIHRFFMVF